jgi:hypothetical protein
MRKNVRKKSVMGSATQRLTHISNTYKLVCNKGHSFTKTVRV